MDIMPRPQSSQEDESTEDDSDSELDEEPADKKQKVLQVRYLDNVLLDSKESEGKETHP
jgi:hypothetical protein